jgi:hypothetical protein
MVFNKMRRNSINIKWITISVLKLFQESKCKWRDKMIRIEETVLDNIRNHPKK